jgi:Transmembrane protein 33/Nucleoporin POM33
MADNSSSTNAENQPRGFEALKVHVSQNKVDCLTWLTRVLTLFFAVRYLIPIYG